MTSSLLWVEKWELLSTINTGSFRRFSLFWSDDRSLTCARKLIIVMTHFGSSTSHVSRRMSEILNYLWSLFAAESAIKVNNPTTWIAELRATRAGNEFLWTFSIHIIFLFSLLLDVCCHWKLHQMWSVFHFLDLILFLHFKHLPSYFVCWCWLRRVPLSAENKVSSPKTSFSVWRVLKSLRVTKESSLCFHRRFCTQYEIQISSQFVSPIFWTFIKFMESSINSQEFWKLHTFTNIRRHRKVS